MVTSSSPKSGYSGPAGETLGLVTVATKEKGPWKNWRYPAQYEGFQFAFCIHILPRPQNHDFESHIFLLLGVTSRQWRSYPRSQEISGQSREHVAQEPVSALGERDVKPSAF